MSLSLSIPEERADCPEFPALFFLQTLGTIFFGHPACGIDQVASSPPRSRPSFLGISVMCRYSSVLSSCPRTPCPCRSPFSWHNSTKREWAEKTHHLEPEQAEMLARGKKPGAGAALQRLALCWGEQSIHWGLAPAGGLHLASDVALTGRPRQACIPQVRASLED